VVRDEAAIATAMPSMQSARIRGCARSRGVARFAVLERARSRSQRALARRRLRTIALARAATFAS
jgi:hypothetical protein